MSKETLKMVKKPMCMVRSGADICNEITCYEAMHEPSLNTKEYGDLVGSCWVSLDWLKEQIERLKIEQPGIYGKQQYCVHALDWVLELLKEGI